MEMGQKGIDYDFEVSSYGQLPIGKCLKVAVEFAYRGINDSNRYGLKGVDDGIVLPRVTDDKLPQEVKDQYAAVKELEIKFQEAVDSLKSLIQAFQQACLHESEKRIMAYERGGRILKHFECPDCGRIRLPRRGLRTQICKLCDGDMKFVGQCADEDRTMVFECKECGHKEETT